MESAAFIQAQNRLHDALERSHDVRDDAEATNLLRDAGQRVLSFLEDLLDDEAMWKRLSSGELAELRHEDVEQLVEFVDGGLPVLLSSLGYRGPPPVDALVDDTVTALALAVPDRRDRFGPDKAAALSAARVASARADLGLFADRLRRLVGTVPDVRPSLARRVLRRALEESVDVLVAVSPILVETAFVAAATGLGLAEMGLAAKIGGAVAGIIAGRLASLRGRRIPEFAIDTRPAFDRARQQLDALQRLADRLRPGYTDDELVRQAWTADEAIRRIPVDRLDAVGANEALDALRMLRDVVAGGTSHIEPSDHGEFGTARDSAIDRLVMRASGALRRETNTGSTERRAAKEDKDESLYKSRQSQVAEGKDSRTLSE